LSCKKKRKSASSESASSESASFGETKRNPLRIGTLRISTCLSQPSFDRGVKNAAERKDPVPRAARAMRAQRRKRQGHRRCWTRDSSEWTERRVRGEKEDGALRVIERRVRESGESELALLTGNRETVSECRANAELFQQRL
jgi:hypothetical protein